MEKESSFTKIKHLLNDADIDAIVVIVGSGCQLKTKNRLRSILTYSASSIPTYGIMDRLTRDNITKDWSYCAGQSYPDEIRTVRNIILGRG